MTSLLRGICHRGRCETESLPAAVGGNWEGFEVVVLSERRDSVFSANGRVPSTESEIHLMSS